MGARKDFSISLGGGDILCLPAAKEGPPAGPAHEGLPKEAGNRRRGPVGRRADEQAEAISPRNRN